MSAVLLSLLNAGVLADQVPFAAKVPVATQRATDARGHFTSKEASENPALRRVAAALATSPDKAADLLDATVGDGSVSSFHECNMLFVAEATLANHALKRLDCNSDASTSPALRAEFEAHCDTAGAYLDLALNAATTKHDRNVVIENRGSLALLRGDLRRAIKCYVVALSASPTETAWANLLIALDRLGAEDIVDRVLVEIGRIGTPRMFAMIASDRDLERVRTRAAYRQHVQLRA